MFFLNHAKDAPLYQELIREGVFNAGLWESLSLPAEGHLVDVLLGNRARIADKPWIDWLIRKHNCTRVPSIEPDYEFIKSLERGLISECLKTDTYPLRAGHNHLYIGLGRPDYPETSTKLLTAFKKEVPYFNALDLNEIAILRNICKEALQTA